MAQSHNKSSSFKDMSDHVVVAQILQKLDIDVPFHHLEVGPPQILLIITLKYLVDMQKQ